MLNVSGILRAYLCDNKLIPNIFKKWVFWWWGEFINILVFFLLVLHIIQHSGNLLKRTWLVAKITVFALEKHSTLQWFLYNSFGTNTTVLRAAAILDHVRIRKIIPLYLRRTQTGQNVDQQHVNENTMLVEIYCLVCVHLYKALTVDRWILFWKLLSPNLRYLVFLNDKESSILYMH